MLVTLTSPPDTQFKGTVSGIEPGKSLTLRNVTCPSSGKYLSEITIKATEIQEVVEAEPECVAPVLESQPVSIKDPAILSLARRPSINDRPLIPSSIPQEEKILAEKTNSQEPFTANTEVFLTEPMTKSTVIGGRAENKELALEHSQDKQEPHYSSKTESTSKKRQEKRESKNFRNRGRKGLKLDEALDLNSALEPSKLAGGPRSSRQTQPHEVHPTFQPFSILKRKGPSRDDDGWATGGAKDVKGLGDFDFEGGLAKFDKNTIFTQLQAEDSHGEEDRLVSHNRLPKTKSGTAGSKNLHFSENVLGQPKPINESSKDEEKIWPPKTFDVSDDTETSQQESTDDHDVRRIEENLSINPQPLDLRQSPEISDANVITLPRNFSLSGAAPSPAFFTVASSQRCESVSPAQMFNLESIAESELGLSEDMMSENSGRGIAEVAFLVCKATQPSSTKAQITSQNTVVFLAGNNKSGLRAISAARHMQNHGISIVVCVLGLDRESELLEGLKRQIKVFRSFGGKTFTKSQFFEFMKQSNVHVDLIIDGLLGLAVSFEELLTADQSFAYELISWANSHKAPVLAIDIPTGIDPTNGKISIIDGRQLHLYAEYIVSMGAPKKGLLEAMSLGLGYAGNDGQNKGQEWQLYVADIGFGAAVWKKAGTKVRKGIEFDGSWVLQMRFQGITN